MTNLRLERGPGDFDLRHQFRDGAGLAIELLPWTQLVGARAVINGWTISQSSTSEAAFFYRS